MGTSSAMSRDDFRFYYSYRSKLTSSTGVAAVITPDTKTVFVIESINVLYDGSGSSPSLTLGIGSTSSFVAFWITLPAAGTAEWVAPPQMPMVINGGDSLIVDTITGQFEIVVSGYYLPQVGI